MMSRTAQRGRILFVLCLLASVQPAWGLLRVNLGIYGGQAHDIATYDDSGTTEVLITVRSQKAVYRKTATGWDAVMTEATEGQEIEEDRVTGNQGIVWATADNQLYTRGPTDPWNNTGWTLRSSVSSPTVLFGHTSGMYIGNDTSVYRSTDGGNTITSLVTFATSSSDRVLSIAVYSSTLFYAIVGEPGNATLYRCEDSGSGFVATAVTVTASATTVTDFEVAGIDPQDSVNASSLMRFYVAGNSAECNAYRTTDGGTTWTKLSLSTNDGYPQYIKFTDYSGGRRVFISSNYSDDYGTTWTMIPNLSSALGAGTILTHPNDGAIAFDPNDADLAYIDSDWAVGVWDMSTGSASEINNAEGIEAVLLNDMSQIQTNATTKATLWVAAKSGLGKTTTYPTTSSSTDWLFPIFPQNDGAPPQAVEINPDDLDIVLAGNSGGAIYRTTNGGPTPNDWTQVLDLRSVPLSSQYTTPERAGITDIKMLASDPNIVYASARMIEGAYEGGIYWSQDNGATWSFDFTNTSSTDLNMPVNALMVISHAVWAGVGDVNDTTTSARGLYARLSVTLDADWWHFTTSTNLDSEVVYDIDGTKIGSVFTVYVTTNEGVYKGTMDSAVTSTWTWTDVTPNGSQEYVAVTVNPTDANEVFAAHDNSIWGSLNGGTTWGLLPPSGTTAHEQVFVLHYDDLLIGTATGLYSPTTEAIDSMDTSQTTGGASEDDGNNATTGLGGLFSFCGLGVHSAATFCLFGLTLMKVSHRRRRFA